MLDKNTKYFIVLNPVSEKSYQQMRTYAAANVIANHNNPVNHS
jgi:hypothetical protein